MWWHIAVESSCSFSSSSASASSLGNPIRIRFCRRQQIIWMEFGRFKYCHYYIPPLGWFWGGMLVYEHVRKYICMNARYSWWRKLALDDDNGGNKFEVWYDDDTIWWRWRIHGLATGGGAAFIVQEQRFLVGCDGILRWKEVGRGFLCVREKKVLTLSHTHVYI